MNTTYSTTGFAQTTASTRRVSSAFKNFWDAFQEWRKWERLRADLCNLNERELMDIGITRGEIDYVASRQTHSRHDVDVSSDLHFFVKLDDVRVVHTKTAMRDGAAD